MSMPCSGTVSKISCRNSWRQRWTPPSATRKTAMGIYRQTTGVMGILQKPQEPVWGVVPGVTAEGCKEIPGITVGANETGRFWLGMLNDLHNRGVKDVLFFCVDGLPGFKEAIQAVFPKAQIQRCVIHMLRNSFKYVKLQRPEEICL